MLVLTRRPGESVRIGDDIEIMIVDADWLDQETRCAVSICDAAGNDLPLLHERIASGVTVLKPRD